jgi:SPP1 gp7 family putative phage head morphogenesis protein
MPIQKTATPLDVFLRHQAYVEGYKNQQVEDSRKVLAEIAAMLTLLLTRSGKKSLGQLTKRELSQFIMQFNAQYGAIFRRYQTTTIEQFRKFFGVDFGIVAYLFGQLGGKPYKGAPADRLWASVQNAPTPGVGDETKLLFPNLFATTGVKIGRLIKIGYTDDLTSSDLLDRITGTNDNNYKDGIINTLGNQLSTTVQTYIQQISAFALYQIGKSSFDEYQWVSVLDNHTTEICNSRDGNVYSYNNGPRPPAHYNCRSTIMPVVMAPVAKMPTYYQWIDDQPVDVQNDILGQRKAIDFRAGRINSDVLPQFSGMSGLTLDQFKAKRDLMLTANKEVA